ncbi:MAG TPA: hypothetical protein VGR80_04865 [Steroidobacteraceae bacterium]|nr:hypothetical protein [Steroidobacteraceae bacterium]
MTDVRALRKAAQRVHDLEQLRSVLGRELGAVRESSFTEKLPVR